LVANYGGSTQWYPAATATTFSVLAVPATTIAPVTTTTTPAVTTTTVALAGAGLASSATGGLSGFLWIDIDRDGRKDKNEPLLPGAEVRVSPAGSVGPTSLSGATASAQSTTTDRNGRYGFPDMAAGSYRAEPVLPEWSALSGGSLNVDVTAGSIALKEFSVTGGATAEALVWDPTRSEPVPGATVSCAWEGIDHKHGTGDEITFTGVSGPDGRHQMSNVPAGDYRCRGVNTDTGARSAVVTVTAAVSALVPASTGVARTRIEIASGGLLATGVDSSGMAVLAMFLLLSGIAVMTLGRRRQWSVPESH